MASTSELVSYIHRWDEANGHLLTQLKALGTCQEPVDNIGICRKAEAKLAEQASLLKTYKECSDKQLLWIRNAMDAIHPECDVTSDPESLKGKTLRLSQTDEIERLQKISISLVEANERLSARVADWDAVCKALWDKGYCQLPQRVNETPLGSCLRLIAEGSPDPANAQAAKPQPDQSNPLFSHVAVHCVDGQVFTTPLPDITSALEAARATTILETVPLIGDDLPLGTAIRFPQNFAKEAMVLGRDIDLVWIAGHGGKGIPLKQLMNENAEYRLPGSDEWKPCHKLVNRTPEA